MESGFWIQQHLDDILLFTYSPVTTCYIYMPWTILSVPTPWIQSYVPMPRQMRPSHSSRRHHPHTYEVPPRRRSRRSSNARMPSTATNGSFNEMELEQHNPLNLNGRIGSGLSQECISDYPISSLGRPTTTKENIICTICQDDINIEEETIILDCGHIYHSNCIEKWLMIKNECAVCRASVIPDGDVERDL